MRIACLFWARTQGTIIDHNGRCFINDLSIKVNHWILILKFVSINFWVFYSCWIISTSWWRSRSWLRSRFCKVLLQINTLLIITIIWTWKCNWSMMEWWFHVFLFLLFLLVLCWWKHLINWRSKSRIFIVFNHIIFTHSEPNDIFSWVRKVKALFSIPLTVISCFVFRVTPICPRLVGKLSNYLWIA